jgi:hypothetical protein
MARHRGETGTAARSGRCRRVVSSEGRTGVKRGLPVRTGSERGAPRVDNRSRTAGILPRTRKGNSHRPRSRAFRPPARGGRLFPRPTRPRSGPDHLPADRVGAEDVGRIPEPVLAAARVRQEPLTSSRVRAGAMSTEVPARRGGIGSGASVTVTCQCCRTVSLTAVPVPVGRCRRMWCHGERGSSHRSPIPTVRRNPRGAVMPRQVRVRSGARRRGGVL